MDLGLAIWSRGDGVHHLEGFFHGGGDYVTTLADGFTDCCIISRKIKPCHRYSLIIINKVNYFTFVFLLVHNHDGISFIGLGYH